MNVIFRVDADSNVGLGHLMRCLALAQQLDSMNVSVIFVVKPSTVNMCKARHDWVGKILILPCVLEQKDEIKWINQHCELNSCIALVLDGYNFDESYRYQANTLPMPLVLFDDNNDTGKLHSKIVINGSSLAEQLGYQSTSEDAVLCLGERFRVLRREFIVQDPIDWHRRNSMTLIMGGSDVLNITLPLLAMLQELEADFPVRVITGVGYQHKEDLEDFIRDSTMSIQHIHNCQQISDIFAHSKFVVSAAGSSQFELLACGTPSMLVVVADNQLNATKQASEQGWCVMEDCRDHIDIEQIAKHAIAIWQQSELLQQMHEKAKCLVDVNGAARVANEIMSLSC